MGLGEALTCPRLRLRCYNIGTNPNSGLPSLRIYGDLSDFVVCDLVLEG